MNKTKMLYYDRPDVSEGNVVNKTSESKEWQRHFWEDIEIEKKVTAVKVLFS